MSSLKMADRHNLEKFLGMSGGYVLDFSDRTFGEFVFEAVEIDSPRSTIDGEARKHAGNLLYCSRAQIVGLFDRAAAALTELRTIATRTLQEELPDEALKIYAKHQALPDAVASLLTGVNLVNMQTQAEARAKVEKSDRGRN